MSGTPMWESSHKIIIEKKYTIYSQYADLYSYGHENWLIILVSNTKNRSNDPLPVELLFCVWAYSQATNDVL